MIQLGDMVFTGTSANVRWEDEFTYESARQSHRRLLGGTLVMFNRPLIQGRPITLVAVEDQGWLTKSQIETLLAMAAQPGAVYTLEIEGQFFQVVFDHSEGPAVSATPLIPMTGAPPEHYYIGTIKLITV